MWSISVLFVLFGPFRFSLVCFCLIRSISVLLCLIRFSLVHFGLFSLIWFTLVHSVLFHIIRSILFFFCFFFRSNLVHSGLFSPIWCTLILFSLLWSFSVHFDALQYIYIYIYIFGEKRRDTHVCNCLTLHDTLPLGFLVSLWVPPVQSKVCHYSTSLL